MDFEAQHLWKKHNLPPHAVFFPQLDWLVILDCWSWRVLKDLLNNWEGCVFVKIIYFPSPPHLKIPIPFSQLIFFQAKTLEGMWRMGWWFVCLVVIRMIFDHVVLNDRMSWVTLFQLIFSTPPKLIMEPKHERLIQMFFLLKSAMFRFQPLVFGGACIISNCFTPDGLKPTNIQVLAFHMWFPAFIWHRCRGQTWKQSTWSTAKTTSLESKWSDSNWKLETGVLLMGVWVTPLKFKSEFTPEKWCLEDKTTFLLGFGLFSGASC